jgi:hypothetical protein
MGSTTGDVRRAIVAALVLTVFAAWPLPLRAIEPADPEMSVEGCEVLDYLASIYGQKRTFTGMICSSRSTGCRSGADAIKSLLLRNHKGD